MTNLVSSTPTLKLGDSDWRLTPVINHKDEVRLSLTNGSATVCAFVLQSYDEATGTIWHRVMTTKHVLTIGVLNCIVPDDALYALLEELRGVEVSLANAAYHDYGVPEERIMSDYNLMPLVIKDVYGN